VSYAWIGTFAQLNPEAPMLVQMTFWLLFFSFVFGVGKGIQWIGRKYRWLNVTDADEPLDPGGLPGFGPKREPPNRSESPPG
jgi:hypothetical protein